MPLENVPSMIDRVRLAEILAGPEEAMRLLATMPLRNFPVAKR